MVVEYESPFPAIPTPTSGPLSNQCYLCNRSAAEIEADPERDKSRTILDREHVIPKVVFKPHSTEQPVILFACGKCNRAKGLDDEYITAHIQVGSFNSGNDERIERVARGLARPKSAGLQADFNNRLKISEVHTSGGIYLGHAPTLEADQERTKTYLTNIAKGLWVKNTQKPKHWDQYDVGVLTEQTAISDNLMYEPWVARMISNRKCMEWWKGHFMYAGAYPDDPAEAERVSFWYLHFYASFTGVVTFAHKDGELKH